MASNDEEMALLWEAAAVSETIASEQYSPKKEDIDYCKCTDPIPYVSKRETIHSRRGGCSSRSGRIMKHFSCQFCSKRINDDLDGSVDCLFYECEKCGAVDKWIKFRIIMDGRTVIGDNIVQLDEKELVTVCDKCIEALKYIVIPRYIYCDICHSEHERVMYSDTQGMGLCGTVMRNVKYNSPWFIAVEQTQYLDGYIINCEYGSCYDACDDYREFVKFAGELPENIKIGMNICDECITKFIKDGICTYNSPSRNAFLAIPPDSIVSRPM